MHTTTCPVYKDYLSLIPNVILALTFFLFVGASWFVPYAWSEGFFEKEGFKLVSWSVFGFSLLLGVVILTMLSIILAYSGSLGDTYALVIVSSSSIGFCIVLFLALVHIGRKIPDRVLTNWVRRLWQN